MTSRVEHISEGVVLHLGDCREILPTLGLLDAIVTDPPYGINAAKRGTIGTSIRRLPNRPRAIELIPGAFADTVELHPEVRSIAAQYARVHKISLSTALAEAVRAYFVGDKAA